MLAPTIAPPPMQTVALRDLVALTKPRLSSLVLITCGGGMLLAPGSIGLLRGLLAMLSTAGIVGAANAVNCYMERDLDRFMARTCDRPLPAGRLEPRFALVVAAVLAAVSFPVLALSANPFTALLGALALLSYVAVYTPLKPRSPLATWAGAVPGAIPPLMGWVAVRGRIEWGGLLLFAILFCWQIPHFLAIAMFRREEYARAGHRVLPLVASDRTVRLHALAWSVPMVLSTLALAPMGFTRAFYAPLAALLGLGFLSRVIAPLQGETGNAPWARKVFYSSLLYLTALFVLLGLGAA